MQAGDIIEWRGVNTLHIGTVTQSEEGELVVIMQNGKSFPLDNLLGANLKKQSHDKRRNYPGHP